MNLSISRLIAILAVLGNIAVALAAVVGSLRPTLAAVLLGIGAAISAFTERVHGGMSKMNGNSGGSR